MTHRTIPTICALFLLVGCSGPESETTDDQGNDAASSDMGSSTPDAATADAAAAADGGGSPDAGPDAPVDTTVAISGAVQKGPFVVGSSVTLNVLDETGNPTGMSFPTTTMNDAGEFAITLPEPAPLRIEGSGFYFDEVRGELSTANLTLRAVFEPTGSSATARVNLVTHLTSDRVLRLVSEGSSYADATATAEAELVAALGIGPPDLSLSTTGVEANVIGNDEMANAYALAISALYLQAAMLAGGTLDAELQQLLNFTVQDLADNGLLDGIGANVPQQLRDAEAILPFMRVQNQLRWRVAELDPDRDFETDPLPDMNHVLDTDDDGVMNIDDVCIAIADPGQEDTDGDGVGDLCDAQFVTLTAGPGTAVLGVCGIHDEGSMGPAGTLMCWSLDDGIPNRYQRYEESTNPPEYVQDIGQLPAGELVEVGLYISPCVRYANGDVYCHFEGEWRRPPAAFDVAYQQITVSGQLACGLTTGGAINCWNQDSEFSLPGTFQRIAAAAGGAGLNLCADTGSSIVCWRQGEPYDMPDDYSNLVVRDLTDRAFVQGRDGKVYRWINYTHAAGQPLLQFGGDGGYQQVAGSHNWVCALHSDGHVRCNFGLDTRLDEPSLVKLDLGPGRYKLVAGPLDTSSNSIGRGVALTDEGRPRHFSAIQLNGAYPYTDAWYWRPW